LEDDLPFQNFDDFPGSSREFSRFQPLTTQRFGDIGKGYIPIYFALIRLMEEIRPTTWDGAKTC